EHTLHRGLTGLQLSIAQLRLASNLRSCDIT
ncbi:IS982 family transposase, partial [Streptococcus agalactiae]|nr:IS982 family transposase [Streptococcus agalactiae]